MRQIAVFDRDHVQAALDHVAAQVQKVVRRGEEDAWQPKRFRIPTAPSQDPEKDEVYWDESAQKLKRWTGSTWQDMT